MYISVMLASSYAFMIIYVHISFHELYIAMASSFKPEKPHTYLNAFKQSWKVPKILPAQITRICLTNVLCYMVVRATYVHDPYSY